MLLNNQSNINNSIHQQQSSYLNKNIYDKINKFMPRYVITQQPLQSQIHQQRYKPRKSTNIQQGVFIQRLREVLQNNRRGNHYSPNPNQYQNSNNYNNNYYSNNNNPYQNRTYKKVGHSRHISQIINPVNNRYDTQKQDNQQEVVYVVQKKDNEGETLRLPKLKKRSKALKNIKYDSIDTDQKRIISNYMNAKLIQFKNPSKRSPKKVKKRVYTLDSVGQLPSKSNKKYYKIQTPIQNLSRYVLSEQNPKRSQYNNQYASRSQFKDESETNQLVQRVYVVPVNKNKNKTVQAIKKKSALNDYINSSTNKIQPIQYDSPSKSDKQTWQLIDPLNLQTYFIKLRKIGNTSSTQNTKMQRTKLRIPQIPTRQNMSNFIKNYIPQFQQVKIQELIKSDNFQIIKDQTDEYKSFYFGQTREDKRYGQGVLITDKSVFQGIWMEDMRVKGIQITELGKYKGDFKDDVRSGKGQFFWAHGQYYSGEWKNGKKNGSGYWKSLKGESYMGQWKNGQVTGYGVHTMKNGQKYEGEFVNFLKHGFGRQSFPNKDYYEGRYVQGQPHGKGKYEWKNGTIYEGQFVQGYRQGKGIIIAPNRLKFEGNFKNENIEGIGRLQSANGDVFNGMFENNKKNGHGILDMKSEHRIIKGIWLNNQLIQQQ